MIYLYFLFLFQKSQVILEQEGYLVIKNKTFNIKETKTSNS
jgi:hypothetical protein